jgi:solute carrier family 25 uncoupling protein 27
MSGREKDQNDKPARGPQQEQKYGLFVNYLFGSFAAAVADVCLFPLDVTRTRMQIQGEYKDVSAESRKNVIRTLISIAQREGVRTLWYGISPSLCRQLVQSGTRLVIYRKLRDDVIGKNSDGSFPVWKAASSGVAAGSIAEFVSTPFSLVKTQMQMDGVRRLKGHPPRVKNIFHGLKMNYAAGGIQGLWRGSVPGMQRAAFVNAAELGFYDSSKQLISSSYGIQNKYLVQLLAGFVAGFWAAVLACPADVIKARVMNQPVDENGRGLYYRGTLDCLLKIVRNEGGFFRMYHAFPPMWMKNGPFSVIFWTTYELTREVFGDTAF